MGILPKLLILIAIVSMAALGTIIYGDLAKDRENCPGGYAYCIRTGEVSINTTGDILVNVPSEDQNVSLWPTMAVCRKAYLNKSIDLNKSGLTGKALEIAQIMQKKGGTVCRITKFIRYNVV